MKEQNIEEIMWKYLDGNCNSAEANAFESRLKNDSFCAKEFERVKILDQSLKETVFLQAPDYLTSKILGQVGHKNQIEHASFRLIPFMILILILLAFTFYLLPVSSESHASLIPIDWSVFEVNLEMSQSYMVYIFGALAAIFLVWLDFFFNRKLLA